MTDDSYIDEEIFNQQNESQTAVENVGFLHTEKNEAVQSETNNRKYFLALPIIGILFIAVFGGGIFGIISWMNYSGNPGENNSVIENTNIETTTEVTPTVEANLNQNTNTETISKTEVSVEPKEKKTKPTVQPTRQPIVKQPPKPTIKKTPKPKPTKRITADDLMNDN